MRLWLATVAAIVTSAVVAIVLPLQAQVSPYIAPPPDNRTQTPPDDPFPYPSDLIGVELLKQTDAQAHQKSAGCMNCHQNVGDPHFKDTLRLGCTDCHGGDATTSEKLDAHVRP